MTDVIQLLPDAIANQIAAGEVIQRPASVVKELMENAIDAGATNIKLLVKEAGKALIQVIDNGIGMSETDARMSFERHATSKIRGAQDLFEIRTMGFRGEALASIAAVAQVEMRTRRQVDELGTRILIESSEVKAQEACQCPIGTNLCVKNLFYNVPARRNFLKNNSVELRHILDEFQRIAIAYPEIHFSLHHNNTEIFHLPAGNLRQRVIAVFGNQTNKKLVPVSEDTDIVKIQGFVGKPEFAKKMRGEQLFYVNRRFIKSAYLNHAIISAYEDLLPAESFPLYVIFLDLDPAQIDINVHPTKQEIKFEDERLIYNYLKVSTRHALGRHSITPTLDFDEETALASVRIATQRQPNAANITTIPSRAFEREDSRREQNNLHHWEQLYKGLTQDENGEDQAPIQSSLTIESRWSSQDKTSDDLAQRSSSNQTAPYQLHASYLVSPIKSGFLLIDQQAAHERILYEKYLKILNDRTASIQQTLFPATIELSPAQATLLRGILSEINLLGFDIQEFGGNTFLVHGVPAELAGSSDETVIIDNLLEQYRQNLELRLPVRENIARAMARSAAIRRGQTLTPEEMQSLIDRLFACELPYKSPTGRNCFLTFELDDLEKRFS